MMVKAILIIIIVIAVVVGGLMTLRNTARMGLPGDDVMKRARQRERELQEQDRSNEPD